LNAPSFSPSGERMGLSAVPSLKGLGNFLCPHPALKRWAILMSSRLAGLKRYPSLVDDALIPKPGMSGDSGLSHFQVLRDSVRKFLPDHASRRRNFMAMDATAAGGEGRS